jgi:hypothetical protein
MPTTDRLHFASPDAMTPQARRRLQRQAEILSELMQPRDRIAEAVKVVFDRITEDKQS